MGWALRRRVKYPESHFRLALSGLARLLEATMFSSSLSIPTPLDLLLSADPLTGPSHRRRLLAHRFHTRSRVDSLVSSRLVHWGGGFPVPSPPLHAAGVKPLPPEGLEWSRGQAA